MVSEFRSIAKQANQLEDELGLTIDDVLNKLTQELGEFNDAVQKYRGRYCRQRAEKTEDLEKEVGDVMLNLASILYRLGLDPNKLPDYAQCTMEKFQERKEVYRRAMEGKQR